MKSALSLLILLVLFSAHAEAQTGVSIPDPGLKAAIEDALWVTDPTPTDMLGLTYLEGQARHITNLTGLEYAVNLQGLSLRFNQIGDLQPLAGLHNLASLSLNDNRITDVSPLSGLIRLSLLDIHNNRIADISALSGLVNVTTLALRENPIGDISALANLTGLSDLSLLETLVSDISPLAGLKSLRHLDLRDCPLNDEAYDVYLPRIRANNPGIGIELDPHRGRMLTLSSTFGGNVIEPGEGEFLYDYDALVHLRAQADPGFVFLKWTGQFPVTSSSADIFMEEDYTLRAHFVSTRDTLYVDDDAPADPGADGSPERPIASIQAAIEVARAGTTIIVYPGVYRENVDLLDKKIYLAAVDPLAPHGGPCATIEGVAGNPVVTVGYGSGSQCGLSGFVITRGRGTLVGAIYCDGASPAISNCLIVGNRCTDPNGAAVLFRDSRAALTNCTLADNWAGARGAGLVLRNSSITLIDSILWENRPSEIRSDDDSHPLIRYCCVRGWWPDFGNIFSNPLFACRGYWADPDDAGVVLTKEDDRAVWMDGDYHLRSQAGRWDPSDGVWSRDDVTSPAIDAGSPASEVRYEPAPNGNAVNMGVYGGTTEASMSVAGVIGSQKSFGE
jgi:hypothetical protein